jgi:hypothetical protein
VAPRLPRQKLPKMNVKHRETLQICDDKR